MSQEKLVNLWLTIAAFIFLAVGFVIKNLDCEMVWEWVCESKDFIGFLCSELGIAFFVALILIYTFEKNSRELDREETEKKVAKISENLFNAIYGRYIPDVVFSEVERSLFSTDIVRVNYSIDYMLVKIDNENNENNKISEKDEKSHFFCEINSAYILKNITDKEIRHTVVSKIEMPIDKELKNNVCFESFTLDGDELTKSDFGSCISTTEDENHMVFKKEVIIGPRSKVDIKMGLRTIRRKTDQEVWSSRLPSNGMTIRVHCPPSVNVQANGNHSTELKYRKISNNSLAKIQEWSIDGGIFPYQSIIFWWQDSENLL